MHPSASSYFRKACIALVALIGVLALTPRRSVGQAGNAPGSPDSAVTLLFIVFPGDSGAMQAMNKLNSGHDTNVGQLQSYAVVSDDKNGKMKVQQKGTKHPVTRGGESAGRDIDRVISSLGLTPNADTSGYAPGANKSVVSDSSTQQMRGALTPGNSAIIAVVPDPSAAAVTTAMDAAGATKVIDIELIPVE
jgi:uncharacterized membrane protein